MSNIQQLDYSVNLLQALLWEYNDALRLQMLLELKQDWYNTNQTEFWNDWEHDVFDLRTANDFGLTVWAIILGMSLSVIVGGEPGGPPSWGFEQYHENFENGNFHNSGTSVVNLSIEQKRIILQLRYFQITTRGAVPEINKFLARIFAPLGSVYVLDGLDMTCEYIFTFQPAAQLWFVLQRYDILPRPAGVGIRLNVITMPAFGFDVPHVNFDRGNFAPED